MENNEIKLEYPIMVKGVKTDILTMSRLKTKHLKLFPEKFLKSITNQKSKQQLSLDVFPQLIPLIASLLGIKEEEADEIDVTDLMKISNSMGSILGNSPSQMTTK